MRLGLREPILRYSLASRLLVGFDRLPNLLLRDLASPEVVQGRKRVVHVGVVAIWPSGDVSIPGQCDTNLLLRRRTCRLERSSFRKEVPDAVDFHNRTGHKRPEMVTVLQ